MTASVDRIGTNVNDLNREVADMRVREQRTADAIDCLAKSTSMRFDSVYKALDCAKRECGEAICPEVMQRYNNWVAPTDQAPATQPISGTINANVTSRTK